MPRPQVSLAAYTIRIRNRITKSNCDLVGFSAEADAIRTLVDYLSLLKTDHYVDQENAKMMLLTEFMQEDRVITGVIRTGAYGYESVILNVDEGRETYKRSAGEADTLPFYFLFYIPRKGNVGVMIVQRLSKFGIRTVLHDGFNRYFNGQFPEYNIGISQVSSMDAIRQQFSRGALIRIKFIRFEVPADISDRLGILSNTQRDYHFEFSVVANRNKVLPALMRLDNMLADNARPGELIELPNWEYDRIKAEVQFGRRRKIVDITNISKANIYHDITDDVVLGPGGHPTAGSVDSQAKILLADVCKGLGIEVPNVK